MINLFRSVKVFLGSMSSSSLRQKAQNYKFKGFEKENQEKWYGPFSFIQAADTQLGLIDRYIEKLPNPGWKKEIKLTEAAIKAVNAIQPRPRFFVVCGDLIDAFPSSSQRRPQEEDFFRLFKELHPDIPLVCVCGNHDVGDVPTPEHVQEYRDKFGDDYFSFFCNGVMFIVINSQFYKDTSKVPDIAIAHEKWLDEQLEEAKSGKWKHVIVFQHIPWFVNDFDEEDGYFNIAKDVRQKMLQKLYDSNVRAIFCGHYHGNAGGTYKDLQLVVTSAIGGQLRNDKSGIRVVTVGEKAVRHTYYPLEEVPSKIELE